MRAKPSRKTTAEIRQLLRTSARPEHAEVLKRFFKTGPGEYGEGDRFLGLRVPAIRGVVRQSDGLALSGVLALLRSKFHEERLLALLILVRRFEHGSPEARERLFSTYMAHREFVNNWDFVDLSAPRILGAWLLDRPRDLLYELAKSANLWERRMAVLATFAFIRQGQLEDTLRLVEGLLSDRHDLIHKGCGWMLREAGDRDKRALTDFLERHAARMPRTMLRYAIEKLPPPERKRWMTR
jgi:3-methyladenine DNA glycosylase AlkD